jgi:hypothetical protein
VLKLFQNATNALPHIFLRPFMDLRGSTGAEDQIALRGYEISCKLNILARRGDADNETLPTPWLDTWRRGDKSTGLVDPSHVGEVDSIIQRF